MNTPSFQAWVEHWGEARLTEITSSSQKFYWAMWDTRTDVGWLWQFPAWELRLGTYWEEPADQWHERWRRCGGRLSEGRMIAAKWDGIWERLSDTFYNGFGHPYPPYAPSSCAYWSQIGQDEAIVSGAISESEFRAHLAQFPREPLTDRGGKPISRDQLAAMCHRLDELIYRSGGPRPGATRAERVAHRRQRHVESLARMQAACAERNRQRDEKDSVFRLLEQVEESLRDAPEVRDARRYEWLDTSLATLTETPYFEPYPNWRARAWLARADLHAQAADQSNELICLERALRINGKLPIKRRINKLRHST